jgi:transcriptional regulator with XRE-family HTH domain
VDDASNTEDLGLASVTSREELAALLRIVHLKADRPSLRALEKRTRHHEPPLSKTVVSEMLRGLRFPRKAVMAGFLRACGVRDDHIESWLHAWEQVALREYEPGQRPAGADQDAIAPRLELLRDQISQQDAVIGQLRLELAAAVRRHVGEEPSFVATGNPQTAHNPGASRRELGALLQELREKKRLNIEEVADYLKWSAKKIQRLEASSDAAAQRDVRALSNLYGVTDKAERDRIMALASEARQPGWWQSYDLAYARYVGLEGEAVTISCFQSSVVNGLLQTPDYARANHEGTLPRLAHDQIDRHIEAKLTRQQILVKDNPPRLTAILDEAALRRMVGGRQVMAGQLAKLLKISARPNVAVRVLPFELGAHPALESNFTILDLPRPTPDMVFVEGAIGSVYLEHDDDLKRYREIFDRLQSIALSQTATKGLIRELRRSYGDSTNYVP